VLSVFNERLGAGMFRPFGVAKEIIAAMQRSIIKANHHVSMKYVPLPSSRLTFAFKVFKQSFIIKQ